MFLGEVRMFAGNFAPRGWLLCHGQLLSIAENTALFSLLGTTYGGDGRTTFALPDLRGRAPISKGTGPALPNYNLGQRGGSATNVLNATQLPSHNHVMAIQVSTDDAEESDATSFKAKSQSFNEEATANQFLSGVSVAPTGGNQAIDNMAPYLSLNYIIASTGTYPSRP